MKKKDIKVHKKKFDLSSVFLRFTFFLNLILEHFLIRLHFSITYKIIYVEIFRLHYRNGLYFNLFILSPER